MKRASIYIAAGLFVAATAVKLLFPQAASGFLAGVRRAVTGEKAAAVETVSGETSAKTRQVVVRTINAGEFLAAAGADEAEEAPAQATDGSAPAEETRETAATAETAAAQETDASLPESVQEAVAVFLEQQSAYSDLAIPANVTYDVYALPFAYETPVVGKTSSGFGYRVHPLEGVTKFHYGTDFAANSGDDIHAFADGVVLTVAENDGYGKFIKIDHGGGYVSLYGHCSKIYVSEGQAVAAGEKIALVGATGKVTGPHLHFELTRNGVYMNPEFYLAAL